MSRVEAAVTAHRKMLSDAEKEARAGEKERQAAIRETEVAWDRAEKEAAKVARETQRAWEQADREREKSAKQAEAEIAKIQKAAAQESAKVAKETARASLLAERDKQKAVKETERATLISLREAEQAERAAAMGRQQAIAKFREAGEGAFTLARGLALTFTSTDEGLQKMLRNVAQVQGFFDIYKGGSKLIQDGVGAFNALSAAGGASTLAMKGLSLALSPVGLAVGAITIGIGSLAGVWDGFFATEAPKWVDHTGDRLKGLNQALEASRRGIENVGRAAEVTAGLSSFILQSKPDEALTAIGGQQLAVNFAFNQQRKQLETIRHGLELKQEFQPIKFGKEDELLLAQSLASLADLDVRQSQTTLDLEKQRYTALQNQLRAADSRLQAEKDIQKTVEASIKAQEESKLTAQERFGRLVSSDPAEAARVAELGRRLKDGGQIRSADEARTGAQFFPEQEREFQRRQAAQFQGGRAFGDVDFFEQKARDQAIKDATALAKQQLEAIDLASKEQVQELQANRVQIEKRLTDVFDVVVQEFVGLKAFTATLATKLEEVERARIQNGT